MAGEKCFTATADGLLRELVTPCWIGQAFDPKTPSSTHPKLQEFTAIWDTGATNSVISPSIVTACGLKPIGMTQIHTAGGMWSTEQYLVNIRLPNNVGFPNVRVTNQPLLGTPILIGMDIIGRGDFVVTNKDGKTTFSYRWPSSERIDFIPDAKKGSKSTPLPQTVGRNSRCPCNSGKKYKNCCGKGVR
jgi:predicted aspartyl protease